MVPGGLRPIWPLYKCHLTQNKLDIVANFPITCDVVLLLIVVHEERLLAVLARKRAGGSLGPIDVFHLR